MRHFSLSPAGRDASCPGVATPPAGGATSARHRFRLRVGLLGIAGLLVAAIFAAAAWKRADSMRQKPSVEAAAYPQLGVALQKDNHADEARAALEAAIKQHPDDALAHLHYGDLLLIAGDPDAAVPHYEIAVRGLPKAISPRLNLAVALGAIGRMREATECAESVLQIDPNNAEAKAILASLPHTDGTLPPR